MDLTRTAVAAAGVAAFLAVAPAGAALGGTADSVQADAAALKTQAAPRAASQASYTVQRLSLDNGTVVDEYLSSGGTVFALSWKGARQPDLAQLLGSYYVEYQNYYSQPRAHTNHVRIEGTNLRYAAGGHMRAFWGTAYVPALVPAGLSTGDLK
jgi:hypothetical protein